MWLNCICIDKTHRDSRDSRPMAFEQVLKARLCRFSSRSLLALSTLNYFRSLKLSPQLILFNMLLTISFWPKNTSWTAILRTWGIQHDQGEGYQNPKVLWEVEAKYSGYQEGGCPHPKYLTGTQIPYSCFLWLDLINPRSSLPLVKLMKVE